MHTLWSKSLQSWKKIKSQWFNLWHPAKQIIVIFHHLSLVANNLQLANPAEHICAPMGNHHDKKRN